MRSPSDRRAAERFGRRAEGLAVLLLRLKGFRILARRVAPVPGTGAGEIDIVGRRGRLVVFVEVKARIEAEDPLDAARALGGPQRRRIVRAATLFLARRPHLTGCDVRFDVVVVGRPGWGGFVWPRHVADAWRAED